MTAKWAAVGLGAAAYRWLGSRHEERRPERAYAERFACYRAGVPHLPLPRGRIGPPATRVAAAAVRRSRQPSGCQPQASPARLTRPRPGNGKW